MRAPTTRAPRSAASGPYGRLMRSYKVQSLFPTVVGVETSERVAALTFDDGPDPEWTPRVLDTLARHGARGTFFLLGRNVDAAPDIARRVVDEGHAIGNHSYSHPCLADCHPLTVARELRKCQRAIRHATGQTTHLMRPPYGAQMVDTYLTARTLGYEVVNWSVSSDDWLGDPAETLAQRVVPTLAPGGIILMHDKLEPPPTGPTPESAALADRSATVAALDLIIAPLKAQGYRFVTVPTLMAAGRLRRQRWFWT
jgi:peptidoglycan/xylan/chitin deacetylase (PgdA/CDA1 family)